MKTKLLLGMINCILFAGCGGTNSARQDMNQSKTLPNQSSTQTSSTQPKVDVKVRELAVYASLLRKLVYKGKAGLTEDNVLIYERTISQTLNLDVLEKEGIKPEVVTDFISKNIQAEKFPKGLDVYFEYELVDHNLSGMNAKNTKTQVVLGFSGIGFTKDLREGLLYVEINNYVKKEVQALYFKVYNDDGTNHFTEFGSHIK